MKFSQWFGLFFAVLVVIGICSSVGEAMKKFNKWDKASKAYHIGYSDRYNCYDYMGDDNRRPEGFNDKQYEDFLKGCVDAHYEKDSDMRCGPDCKPNYHAKTDEEIARL